MRMLYGLDCRSARRRLDQWCARVWPRGRAIVEEKEVQGAGEVPIQRAGKVGAGTGAAAIGTGLEGAGTQGGTDAPAVWQDGWRGLMRLQGWMRGSNFAGRIGGRSATSPLFLWLPALFACV